VTVWHPKSDRSPEVQEKPSESEASKDIKTHPIPPSGRKTSRRRHSELIPRSLIYTHTHTQDTRQRRLPPETHWTCEPASWHKTQDHPTHLAATPSRKTCTTSGIQHTTEEVSRKKNLQENFKIIPNPVAPVANHRSPVTERERRNRATSLAHFSIGLGHVQRIQNSQATLKVKAVAYRSELPTTLGQTN